MNNGGTGNINSCKYFNIQIVELEETFDGVYIDFIGINGGTIFGAFVVKD